jgi:hypothetical protein
MIEMGLDASDVEGGAGKADNAITKLVGALSSLERAVSSLERAMAKPAGSIQDLGKAISDVKDIAAKPAVSVEKIIDTSNMKKTTAMVTELGEAVQATQEKAAIAAERTYKSIDWQAELLKKNSPYTIEGIAKTSMGFVRGVPQSGYQMDLNREKEYYATEFPSTIGGIVSRGLETLKPAFEKISTFSKNVFSKIGLFIKNVWDKAVSATKTATSSISNSIDKTISKSTGMESVQGMAEKMNAPNMASAVVSSLDHVDSSLKRTSGEWIKLRNVATREMLSMEKALQRTRERMDTMLSSGKAVAPFSRDSGEADAMIKSKLAELQSYLPVLGMRPGSDAANQYLDQNIEEMLSSVERLRSTGGAAETYKNMQAQIEKYSAALQKASESQNYFNEQVEQTKAAENAARVSTIAAKNSAEAWKKMQHGLGRSMLMFAKVAIGAASLYRLLRKLARAFMESVTANKDLADGLGKIKGNLSVAWQAIFQSMVPALQILAGWLVKATTYLAMFFVALSGTSWSAAVDAAKEQANAISGVGSAAKKAKGDLAAFDAINKLSQNSTGGGSSGISAVYGDQEEIPESIIKLAGFLRNIGEAAHYAAQKIANFWNNVLKIKIQDFWDNLSSNEGVRAAWTDLETTISTTCGNIMWIFGGLQKAWDSVSTALSGSGGTSFVSGLFGSMARNIVTFITHPLDQFNLFVSSVKSLIDGDWQTAMYDFFRLGMGPLRLVGQLIDNLIDTIPGLREFMDGVSESVNSAFHVAVTSVLSWVENVLNDAISVVNGIITKINKTFNTNISKIQEVSFSTAETVYIGAAKTGSSTQKAATLHESMFHATGGIFDRPTLGVIGERGREAVLPLENNTEWMDDLVYKMAGVMSNRSSQLAAAGAGGGDVTVYVGTEKWDSYTVRGNDRRSTRSNGRGL